jgi:hypothetical protein
MSVNSMPWSAPDTTHLWSVPSQQTRLNKVLVDIETLPLNDEDKLHKATYTTQHGEEK